MKNQEVTTLLDVMQHPKRKEIEMLRDLVLSSHKSLQENTKWNGPNYHVDGNDRVSLKINPPKNIMIIFHCGVKTVSVPDKNNIDDSEGLLGWKGNDRAVVAFSSLDDVVAKSSSLKKIIKSWIKETV